MQQALDRIKASLDHEAAFLEHDVDFHRALAAASHNRLAIVVNDAVIGISSRMTADSMSQCSLAQRIELNLRVYETHNDMFKAVVAQDIAEATRCADAVWICSTASSHREGVGPISVKAMRKFSKKGSTVFYDLTGRDRHGKCHRGVQRNSDHPLETRV